MAELISRTTSSSSSSSSSTNALAGTAPAAITTEDATKGPSSPSSSFLSRLPSWPRIQQFLIKNALSLGFLVGVIWALTWPQLGQATSEIIVGRTAKDKKGLRLIEYLNNIFVFLISGLMLQMSDLHHLGKNWPALVYGLVGILLVTPVLALALQKLPIDPPEFPNGLAIFCVVPTTLGVGVALTHAAHGNLALSLLLTVATNMLGCITVPFLLHLLLAGGGGVVDVNPGPLAYKLVLTVLIPTVLGMAIRASHIKVRHWVTRHKTSLSLFSTFNLVVIIWQTLSAAHDVILRQSATDLVLVGLAAIMQHLFYLAFNYVIALPLLRLPLPEAVSVIIMTSQKAAPVAVTVIAYLTDDVAQQGLFAIPCLLGQLAQIFIGSVLATKLAVLVDRMAEERERELELKRQGVMGQWEDSGGGDEAKAAEEGLVGGEEDDSGEHDEEALQM